jgi:hypothetical protein
VTYQPENEEHIIFAMPRLYRWIIAVLLMLCLPLQGMAAVALPMGMAHESAIEISKPAQANETADQHCMQQAQDEDKSKQSATPCDNCFTCHIIVAQALMPATAQIHIEQGSMPVDLSIGDKVAFLTFPFFRPPISA